ncbi:MAG: hypothetical protein ABI355_09410 [Solirubrobacteraceae bacterium]
MRRRPREWLRRLRWPLSALAVLAVSAAVVAWAQVRPGYDPYGWLTWGHLTLHGKLDTNGAPSWKPLPYLFTLPYALTGRDAVYLWMTTAFAISLSGLLFAWRVAYWLVAPRPDRRWAGHLAGFTAAAAVIGIYSFPHSILSAESDTMIVALCLAAGDAILCRRLRWAFWALWLAALGRPEAWSLLILYGAWAAWTQPRMRWQVVLGIVLVPLLWFGIPALSSKSPFTAATLAENSVRALHGNKLTGTIERFLGLEAVPIKVAAALATVLAIVRRDRGVIVLAAAVVVWVAVEVGFALHGYSAVPRYIYEAGAGTAVLAGVFVGRVIIDVPAALGVLRLRVPPAAAGLAVVAIVLAFAGSLVPVARSRVADERDDLARQRARAVQVDQLEDAVRTIGGDRILRCGHPKVWIAWQSVLAWDLGTNVGSMFFNPGYHRRHPHSIVNLYPHDYGWQIFGSDWTDAEQAARCQELRYKTGS